MYAFGWILLLVGIVFGVVGGLANLLLAHSTAEFWTISLPVAVVGIGAGWYLVGHARENEAR